MNDNTFELSRRTVLAGLGSVGVASAGAGLGTSAYFNDTEEFEGNRMVAGELDLRIDWQQQYYGPSESWEFVNAHPDHDGDGEQSLRIDGTEYTYSQNGGANLDEQITCETLDNEYDYSGNPDYTETDQESLIWLDDVKPGDRGEITFSYHLCDNPGYVWFTGQLTEDAENGVVEPEDGAPGEDGTMESPGTDGELAENLQTMVWYDLDCDNEYDEGESIIFEWGALDDVLQTLSDSGGVMLDPSIYSGNGSTVTELDENNEYDCPTLGKIEWDDGGFVAVDEDKPGEPFFPGGTDVSGSYPSYEQAFEFDGTGIVVGVDFELDGDGEPLRVDLDVIDGVAANEDTGLCLVDVFGANNHTLFGGACTREIDDLFVYDETDGQLPIGEDPDDAEHAISHIRMYYCPTEDDVPPSEISMCFDPDVTYCLGFEWQLPATVGNAIQSDSVMFDLGFYTEQCRHNDAPNGPPT